MFRQIVYISSSTPRGTRIDVAPILDASRRNNPIDGVTGLLYTDGIRFLQALEGPAYSVEKTFDRIEADRRHHAIVILSDREVDDREFGDWAMAHRSPGDTRMIFDERVRALLSGVSDDLRGTFLGLIEMREGA